ncbi:RNA polymerase sigma factor [Gemmatirosa kalamazoonensis]|uniref:RNA polymerase sigma factor n=1 Tax=Gemmatirosa kalamazoonensis TaxID=861299 RepID=W0REZ3_9BACT|nr:sigma-70 family RNA polymerase sigma factor [Gemmatirosa kalamazoonensis]AHG89669.1 RNA polymerase sigma factor [Gemmatirosa kalamazoonensis]
MCSDFDRDPASPAPAGEITALLHAWHGGEADAMERLAPLVYDALRGIAERHMRRERPGHTLSPTALVHEAWLRLDEPSGPPLRDRTHFLAVASRVMRRVLVDHARRGLAERRDARAGIGARPTLKLADASPEEWSVTMLALDDAMDRLTALDPRLQRIVECRFFGGLSEDETAAVLGVSARTVNRDWRRARAWLEAALRE